MEKILKYKREIAFSLFLVFLLAMIRAFEAQFYDPFLYYFKGDYMQKPLPEYESLKLFLSLLLRYALNSFLSLGIILILFKDLMLTKFAAILYAFFFLVLIIAFFIILGMSDPSHNFLLFYVRRFLIQPLFVLLFVPAFYYQNQISIKNNKS